MSLNVGADLPVCHRTNGRPHVSSVRYITMLDAAFVRDNLAAVKANCANRNVPMPRSIGLSTADEHRKTILQQLQALQQR